MTPIALLYLILGLVAMIWPLTLLLIKRKVLSAQWLLAISLFMMAISFILYSCLFNTFLKGEYLLVVLYMLFALATPPTTMLAVTSLTQPQGVRRLTRAFFLPVFVMAVLMVASVIIGGVDMYRLWIYRGSIFEAHLFFSNSWRYNTIVFIHMYLFSTVLTIEVATLSILTILRFKQYRKTVHEYYTHNPQQLIFSNWHFFCIAIVSFLVALSLLLFPFNAPRPFVGTLLIVAVEGIAVFILGYRTYNINYSAETLRKHLDHSPRRVRRDLHTLGIDISHFIENGAYRDPDLSVFSLASRFHVSQDQIVDAIHKLHGLSFADYVDTLRVEHAVSLLTNRENTDDSETLEFIAHQCGYLHSSALQHAFKKVMKYNLNGEESN